LELWVAGKILLEKRRHVAISVVGLLCVLGVMAGVTALIVVMSVMNGFAEDLKERILGVMPHVVVMGKARDMEHDEGLGRLLRGIPHVDGVSPYLLRDVIIQGPVRASGAVLKGVDLTLARDVMPLFRIIKGGEVDSLAAPSHRQPPGILLGRELMYMLGCVVGDVVTVVSPLGGLTPWGRLPKWRRFRVVGFLDSGYWEFDSSTALIDLKVAQELFQVPGRVTGIELRVDDPYRASQVRKAVQEAVKGRGLSVQDWMQRNKNLLFALTMEKRAMFVILSCIVAVAALLIISILMMMVLEKKKDIAILKALGATTARVMRIFVWQGAMLGSAGCLLGCIAGVLISLNVDPIVRALESLLGITFFPSDVYLISELPSKLIVKDLAVIVVVTIMMSVVSSLYPAWRAARVDPVEGIRQV
jgi:lipoprotein-releasing system permease protein